MQRRTFNKVMTGAALALVAGFTIPLTGCSAITSLEQWIPVALSAVAAIVKLLGPIVPPPVAAIIVLIQAGFSALLTAIENYKAGSGVLADISNAIAAIESSFASFFQSLNVPSTLLNLIEGLAGIILSTISAFANSINPAPAPVTMAATIGGGVKVAYTPQKRSVSKFKSDWNKECVGAGHPEARI